VIVGSVGTGRHANKPSECRAERTQRGEPHLQTDLGHGQITPAQQRHRPLDPTRLQVAVRRFTEGLAKPSREVSRRHKRRPRHRRNVQRTCVLAVEQISRPTQVSQLSRVHHINVGPSAAERRTWHHHTQSSRRRGARGRAPPCTAVDRRNRPGGVSLVNGAVMAVAALDTATDRLTTLRVGLIVPFMKRRPLGAHRLGRS
jgi:hypothetical protein